VDVLERGDDVVFLHAVVEGAADKSYGVHVARLAGVPDRVTRRAAVLLRELEVERSIVAGGHVVASACATCAELEFLNVLGMTPLEAHATLARIAEAARQ
jgi:DNA mismatch repair protein MutS